MYWKTSPPTAASLPSSVLALVSAGAGQRSPIDNHEGKGKYSIFLQQQNFPTSSFPNQPSTLPQIQPLLRIKKPLGKRWEWHTGIMETPSMSRSYSWKVSDFWLVLYEVSCTSSNPNSEYPLWVLLKSTVAAVGRGRKMSLCKFPSTLTMSGYNPLYCNMTCVDFQ